MHRPRGRRGCSILGKERIWRVVTGIMMWKGMGKSGSSGGWNGSGNSWCNTRRRSRSGRDVTDKPCEVPRDTALKMGRNIVSAFLKVTKQRCEDDCIVSTHTELLSAARGIYLVCVRGREFVFYCKDILTRGDNNNDVARHQPISRPGNDGDSRNSRHEAVPSDCSPLRRRHFAVAAALAPHPHHHLASLRRLRRWRWRWRSRVQSSNGAVPRQSRSR